MQFSASSGGVYNYTGVCVTLNVRGVVGDCVSNACISFVDVADTLRYLLAGSGEITLENIEVRE